MKKAIMMIAAASIAAAMPVGALAYDTPESLRIGLESVCKNAASASVGAGEILIGTADGAAFEEGGSLSSASAFSVRAATGSYIAVEDEMDCADALDLAEELADAGFDAYAAYLGDADWTVYVQGADRSEVEDAADADAARVSNFEGYTVSGSDGAVIVPEDAVLMGTGTADTISLNGKRYRGMLTFAVNGTALTAVNVLGLEEYLYGVVPSEMPQSYEMEALKAQAVAARTYAMTKIGAHTADGYQLCDTTACQVYLGYSGEASRTNDAVDATAGEVACYNGAAIEAVFSASTGGYTENSENVWGTEVAYLRAVPEIAEYGDNTWTKTLTLDELDALLQKNGESIGTAQDIVITKLSTGGRVQELQIVGSRGTKTLTGESIRTYFGGAACGSLPGKMFTINGKGGEIGVYGGTSSAASTQSSAKGGLLSAVAADGIIAKTEGTLSYLNGRSLSVDVPETTATRAAASDGTYEVYDVNISTVKNGQFVFAGVGKGHGVGLSQNGAQAMAQQGYDYEEILLHYYTGITIED